MSFMENERISDQVTGPLCKSQKKPINLDKPLIHILILAIFGFLVYSNTLHSPFLLDDNGFILHNPYVKNPILLKDDKIISDSMSDSFFSRFNSSRRVVFLTFALNYKLHGFDQTGFHLFNIAIHIINSLFLYLLIVSTFKTPFFTNARENRFIQNTDPVIYNQIALFSGLIFVCHPVQTMAVTYITQRFTSLATLFYLLSLLTYISSRLVRLNTTRYAFYLTSIISSVLAMKSKEISFTLPVIIALYEFMFFTGSIKKRVFYLIPLLLTMLIIPLSIISNSAAIDSSIRKLTLSQINTFDYAISQLRVIVTYFRLLFFPINQQIDYDFPWHQSFFEPEVFLSFILLLTILVFGVFLFNRLRIVSFGIFWFYITLSVESSVISLPDLIWEHRLYLPSIGFIISAVSSAFFLFMVIFKNHWIKKAFVPIILSAVVLLSVTTYFRNAVWQDDVSIWRDNVSKAPNKARIHDNLGIALGRKGRLKEAENEFRIALKINPRSSITHNNLGANYCIMGRYDEAINEFITSLKLNPNFAEAHLNLGIAYRKQGRIEKAIREFRTALDINPNLNPARNHLLSIYSSKH